jgi:hypothetical protein
MVDEVCVSAVNRFIECLRPLSQPATKDYVKIKGIVGRDFFIEHKKMKGGFFWSLEV